MKKFLILCAFVIASAINFAAFAAADNNNKSAVQCHSEWVDDWLLEVYFDNAKSTFPTIGDKSCEEAVKTKLAEKMRNDATGNYILIASTSSSGSDSLNRDLAKNRKNTVANLIGAKFKNFKNSSNEDWVVGVTNAIINNHHQHDWTDRMVMVVVNTADNGVDVDFSALANAYVKLKGWSFEANVWRDEQGKFNTSRLISDSVAGIVLGTAGGLITSSVIKKNQIKEGFEDIQCVIGGQTVANWGDEFIVK